MAQRSAAREPEIREKPAQASSRKLTYKETVEFGNLEREIDALEGERADLESRLSSGLLGADELQQCSRRFGEVLKEIDAKTDRWIELSEKSSS
jgi:ATP-binding cassette subfamily F protein uup